MQLLTVDGKFGENHYAPEGVYIDIEDIKKAYRENQNNISAIVSTTSFFAPRVPDNIKEIAKFAQEHNIIHIINNAYGIQSEDLIKLIRSAIDSGRVDAIVQSTDKNFLTPVGGSVILSPHKPIIHSISSSYAGRASSAPIVQLLVSLLNMGVSGYMERLEERNINTQILKEDLEKLAKTINEHVMKCNNTVSYAMTLRNLTSDKIEKLGGFLYNLRVTGPRVMNVEKNDFGSCTSDLPWSYVVINAAIGAKKDHVIMSVSKLKEALEQLNK